MLTLDIFHARLSVISTTILVFVAFSLYSNIVKLDFSSFSEQHLYISFCVIKPKWAFFRCSQVELGIRNSWCARKVRREYLYLTIKTLLNRKVIKAQLNDLSIEDETDIFIFLAIEQTWITPILLHLETRHFIPRLGEAFQKTWCHSLTARKFLDISEFSQEVLIWSWSRLNILS